MFKKVILMALNFTLLFSASSCDLGDRKKKKDDNFDGKTVMYQVVPETMSLTMCYIIKTDNNKIIVIDGGIDGQGLFAPPYLLEELRKITGLENPTVHAWILTHAHHDHYFEFVKMVEEKSKYFTVENVYFNFPSEEFVDKHAAGGIPYFTRLKKAYDKLFGENSYEEYEGVQAGDIIDVDNVRFEILQIPDESITANGLNNSSIIFRMTVEGQTVLFTGDAGVEAGNALVNKYGDSIKSDFVQMAHHGQGGLNKEQYAKIDPKVCLWPIPLWVWENKDQIYATDYTKQWMFEELKVKHHYITGLYGTEYIVFPFDFNSQPKNKVEISK